MRYLFEVSWEVCNMVGGIHTVLATKAPHAVAAFGEGYYLLGPLLEKNTGFVETDEECFGPIRDALGARNLPCRLGRWQIGGTPKVILVDFRERFDASKLLYGYWQRFGVDSYGGHWDYVEPVLFSTACGEVIEAIHRAVVGEDGWGVAHFHEWMGGGGLLHLKKAVPEIGTVFTTHATVLGRAMAGSGRSPHAVPEGFDPEEEASALGVSAKHSMEAATAREADCFTTVSRVTADEAAALLDRRPARVVHNGLNIDELAPFAVRDEAAAERRALLLRVARRFLHRDLPPETRLWVTSGRYEFRNKGFDLFLRSLGGLDTRIASNTSAPPVVAWFLLAAGHRGLQEEFRRDVIGEGATDLGVSGGVATHRLYDEHHDAITQACHGLNLRNTPENKVNVIFCPAYLDGHDGLFDRPYLDVLSACDLGVFPSFYEPWGYTPQESTAVGVPAVTTDLAGFGRWAMDLQADTGRSVSIIARAGRSDDRVVGDLEALLAEFSTADERALAPLRQRASEIARLSHWTSFFEGYLRAYDDAAGKARKRLDTSDTSSFSEGLFAGFRGGESSEPRYRPFTVVATLPPQFEELREMAGNLWWSWHPDAEELFADLDPDTWKQCARNPVRLLATVSKEALERRAADTAFLKRLGRVLKAFRDYVGNTEGRFSRDGAISDRTPVAYLSTEFCLHETLPIYSGGLGVLAGDHLKAASDLNVPLVGVGLLYHQGYFRQKIDREGNQIEEFSILHRSELPMHALFDEDGHELTVSVEMGGRTVHARAWQVSAGRNQLYLLDADVGLNTPRDRQITWQLYPGDRRTRLEQETLLGIGGVKLLEDALRLSPSVYHVNEGHCAFLLFERIRRLMKRGFAFQEAREAVRASTIFTTHTPVPAGHETFERDLMELQFTGLAGELGIPIAQLLEMGHARTGDESEPFSMTILALKLASQVNGVSKLHGAVCREMWHGIWKGVPVEEVPITSITNGVHITSWIGRGMRRLLGQYLDVRWDENHDDPDAWQAVEDIPDAMLWEQHQAQKRTLIEAVKEKVFEEYLRRGEDLRLVRDTVDSLSEDALTVGVARRMASYKRMGLLFDHRELLARLVLDAKRPIQFIFAGKAHPADKAGKEVIKTIFQEARSPEFRGRIVYLEDYEMSLSRLMVQGVDLWLNMPLRPHEASGTSGMKVVGNGGLNCGIRDGWWDEAFEPGRGWAIEDGGPYLSKEHQDEVDAAGLMNLLEREIVPLYYDVGDDGIPFGWVAMMKEALRTLCPRFSTMRMLSEYWQSMYVPTADRGRRLADDDYRGIRELAAWKRRIRARFATVSIERITTRGIKGDVLSSDDPLHVEILVNPGKIAPHELKAELVIGLEGEERFAEPPQVVPFDAAAEPRGHSDGLLCFRLSHPVPESGRYLFAVRVVPFHPLLASTNETGLVCWA